MLATKFLLETLGKLNIENEKFSGLLRENYSTFSQNFELMVSDPSRFNALLDGKKPDFFVAFPISTTKMPSEVQKNYTIAAVDGSQIVSDDLDVRVSPFVLINIGLIQTNYPREEVVKFESYPTVISQSPGRNLANEVATYRTKSEFEKIEEVINNMQESNIMLVDGGLLQWHLTENSNRQKEEVLDQICHTLQTATNKQVHLLGYISGTNARDVVGSLKVMQCTEPNFTCTNCENSYCYIADRIKDETVFLDILPDENLKGWHISSLFKSNAPMTSEYYKQDIFFFYLYNQFEFARIECTAFSISHLPFIISVLLDQLEKGFGYPVVLQEAHELAVLQNKDKVVIEQFLVQQNSGISKLPFCRLKNLAKKVKYI